MMADPKCINIYDDNKCGLFEFTNEDEAIQVGYLGWISIPDKIDVITDYATFYNNLIKNKTDIVMKWPKCDVIYSSKMIKLSKKVEWINVSARLLAHGSWVEMCDKSNSVINFDETKTTRSTRRVRHRIEADNLNDDETKDKNMVVQKKFCKTLFKKHKKSTKNKILGTNSSVAIMKELEDEQECITFSSGDDEEIWKSSKQELRNQILVLNAQNKALRTQVSQQREIIEASKHILHINEMSKKILSSLTSSYEIIDFKTKIHHPKNNNIKPTPMKNLNGYSSDKIKTSTLKIKEKKVICNDSKTTSQAIPYTNNDTLMLPLDFGEDIFDLSAVAIMNEATDHSFMDTEKCDNYSKNSDQLKMITAVSPNICENSNFQELVDLWPGSGVKVDPSKLALVNRRSPAKLVGDLMLIIFNEDELKNGSVSGKKCNFIKSDHQKKKLDENKTMAIYNVTLSIFPDTKIVDVEKSMRMKLNNYNKTKFGSFPLKESFPLNL